MGSWNPDHYLKFGDERTRPSLDLVSHIAVECPEVVIDLGCGPGNSTQVLTRRWPEARVLGLDSSEQMIEAARVKYPHQEWIVSTIEGWSPEQPVDVVFSNAALQWLPDHGPLVARLFGYVARGGALAFQIPSADFALVRALIHEVARAGAWAPRMRGPLHALTMEPVDFYYDRLASSARKVDMWETEYIHVMESATAIVEWMSSTGLRPFLDVLESQQESERFVAELTDRVVESYPPRSDGRVLFPFKRTFVIVYA